MKRTRPYNRDWDRGYRQSRRERGLCHKCSEPCMENSCYCPLHKQKNLDLNRERRQYRKDNNLCQSCGEPIGPDGTTIFCGLHRQLRIEQNRKNYAKKKLKLAQISSTREWLGITKEKDKEKAKPSPEQLKEMLNELRISQAKTAGKCIARYCQWKAMPSSNYCIAHKRGDE